MKLSTKLYGTVGALTLIGLLVSAAGICNLRKMGKALDVATNRTAVVLDLVSASRSRSWEMIAALRGLYLFGSLQNRAEFDSNLRRFDAAFKRAGQQIDELRPLMTAEGEPARLAQYESVLVEFGKDSAGYIRLCREGHFDQVTGTLAQLERFTNLSESLLNTLKDQERKIVKESQQRSESMQAQCLVINLLVVCGLMVIAGLSTVVVGGVGRTLGTASSELFEGARQVAAAAGQVASASQSMAQGASEQAASLEETSAASEEINATARQNAANSKTAAELVAQSQQRFCATDQSLQQMVAAMGEINASSGKIEKIIKAIDEIAFQTNILALNAAVEAARAGEAGMGFAVVADEVRNLAQRSAQAAKDTAVLIEESIARSRGGKAKVEEVATAMQVLTGEAGKVKTLVEDLNLGSLEQTRGVQQVARTIADMQKVAQSSAASAQESAAASEQLTGQAAGLEAIARKLTALVEGSAAAC